ncbi:MAG: methyltransferase domain-containing protein [Pseudooceanicola nanhaiensis]
MSDILRSIFRRMHMMNTARALKWDLTRRGARRRTGRMIREMERTGGLPDRLHFGSGSRKVPGWLNTDVVGTDVDVDLGLGALPFPDDHFEYAVAQQVIEHLELEEELQPLLADIRRCMKPGGEIWLSCPNMEVVCRSYLEDGGATLIRDKQSRWPDYSTRGYADSQVVNYLFHQDGQHKNLFDFTLLKDVLEKAGFRDVQKRSEVELRDKFPEFPERNDDFHALYVSAVK